MSRPAAYLFTGPESLLVRRAADALLAEVRAEAGGELDVTEVRGADLGEDRLPDLRTQSLFAVPRAYVVRDAETLPKAASDALLHEVKAGVADALIVLLSKGTKPIMKLAKAIKDAGGRVDVAPPRDFEDRAWRQMVVDEFSRHDRTATPEAVNAILDAAGLSVNAIAEKVAQSVNGTTDRKVDVDTVERVVVGHGSRGAFAVADAMVDRDTATALTLLRGCIEAGDHPVQIVSALTYKLRQLIAVAAGVDGRAVGLSISRPAASRLQRSRTRFGPGELTTAMQHLAACDLEIKSGDLDPVFAVERAVVGITAGGVPVPDPDREILR